MSRAGRQGIAGNRRAQDQLRVAEERAKRQRTEDLRELMALPAGRRFLWDLIDRRCACHGTGYSNSGSEMYFLAGQRAVGCQLRVELQQADVRAYAMMMHEALVEEADRRIRSESAEAKAQEDDEGAPESEGNE